MISVVVAVREPQDAAECFGVLESSGNEIQPIVVMGAPTILDAYREGQARARGRFVLYLHDDVTLLSTRIEDLLEAWFRREPDCGFIGVHGNLRRLACGISSHAPSSEVGHQIVLDRDRIRRKMFEDPWIARFENISHGILNMAREVAFLDGNMLATDRKDWRFDPTSRADFLGSYEIDVAMEAKRRGLSLFAAPFPAWHWAFGRGREPQAEAIIKRLNAQFERINPQSIFDRWGEDLELCDFEVCGFRKMLAKRRELCRTS